MAMQQIGKSIGLAFVTLLSVLFITKSVSIAFAISLIPLLLGSFGIIVEFAYGLAAVCLITAAFWAIAPKQLRVEVNTMVASTVQSFSID